MNNNSTNNQLAVIVVLAALAVLGVVVITLVTIPLQQQAEARGGCENGIPASAPAFNASKLRCFHG
jgi:hypothetical protein